MPDIYLYDDVPVLKNKLGIKDSDLLDAAEAGMSRANMMLLYESGFQDFSPAGLCEIHRRLFSEVYEWAGKFRTINIENVNGSWLVGAYGTATMIISQLTCTAPLTSC